MKKQKSEEYIEIPCKIEIKGKNRIVIYPQIKQAREIKIEELKKVNL